MQAVARILIPLVQEKELRTLTGEGSILDVRDRGRFSYPWANDGPLRQLTGDMVSVHKLQRLVASAIECESQRAHESTWNENIHHSMLKAALSTSRHAKKLVITSLYVNVHSSRRQC